MSSIDLEVFGGLVAELCPNLALCALAILEEPEQPSGAGTLDREAARIGGNVCAQVDQPAALRGRADFLAAVRREVSQIFWRQFVGKYLSDQPAIRRAA